MDKVRPPKYWKSHFCFRIIVEVTQTLLRKAPTGLRRG
jgi:hypothetical protein